MCRNAYERSGSPWLVFSSQRLAQQKRLNAGNFGEWGCGRKQGKNGKNGKNGVVVVIFFC